MDMVGFSFDGGFQEVSGANRRKMSTKGILFCNRKEGNAPGICDNHRGMDWPEEASRKATGARFWP
jgi:hypothetical protein